MNDGLLLAAVVGIFLLGLVLLGVIADSWERRDARRRNPKRWR